MELGTSGKAFAIYPVVKVLAVPRSIACVHRALIDVPSTSGDERSLSILGALRDDVDYSIYGVRSPDSPTWSADDFNPVDVLQQRVLNFPIHAAEEGRINASAVDQHEYRAGKAAFESAHTHRPLIGVDSRYFHSRHQSECLWNACGSGSSDIFLRDDINRRRRSSDFHRLFGNRRNLSIPELFQAQLRETLPRLSIARGCICPAFFHRSHDQQQVEHH